jgi:hypothetical protein
METKTSPVRRWLQENRIFFETAATSLLSVMALILSWGSLHTSMLQTRIQIAQAQPIFAVQSHLVRNAQTDKFDDITFSVRNIGAAASAFTETTQSFISINYMGPLPESRRGTTTVPIYGYLPFGETTGDSTGLLCTLKGPRNNAMVAALTDEVDARAHQMGGFARMGVFSVFELRYTDLLGGTHQVFYRVSDFGGAPMDDVEAHRLIDLERERDQKSNVSRDLSEIHSDQLLLETGLLHTAGSH